MKEKKFLDTWTVTEAYFEEGEDTTPTCRSYIVYRNEVEALVRQLLDGAIRDYYYGAGVEQEDINDIITAVMDEKDETGYHLELGSFRYTIFVAKAPVFLD